MANSDNTSRAADTPMLSVRNLSAQRSGKLVFTDVSLDVPVGERVYIHGENGAGKSTLLETLLGLHPRRSGTFRWLGGEGSPADAKAFLKGDVFYLPQFDNLFPSLTLRENALIGSRLVEKDANERIGAALESLPPLREAWRRRPAEVSAGQRQLAACIRLAARSPKLIVLDEPTAGVSMSLVSDIYNLFANMFDGTTSFVFTDQHVTQARGWCTVAFQLRDGELHQIQ